jgi:nucleotide-binding universal stress UspA family protein
MSDLTATRDVIAVGIALEDGDTGTLLLARQLAGMTGAPLALVHAYPFDELIAVAPPRWEQELEADALERLEELAAPLRERTPVTVHLRANPSPVRALHEAAEELGASVLVVGASRRRHRVTGGIGDRLLHAAPCAVAIAPAGYSPPPRGMQRIGVGYIAGPEGDDALAVAAGLASRSRARVHTYTVIEPAAGRGSAGREVEPDRRSRVAATLEKARTRVPADVLEGTHVLEGRAADALAGVSAELDLLICGSRGYGPVRSMLLGIVSWELAHSTACPLLVIPRAPIPGLRTLTGEPTGRPGT